MVRIRFYFWGLLRRLDKSGYVLSLKWHQPYSKHSWAFLQVYHNPECMSKCLVHSSEHRKRSHVLSKSFLVVMHYCCSSPQTASVNCQYLWIKEPVSLGSWRIIPPCCGLFVGVTGSLNDRWALRMYFLIGLLFTTIEATLTWINLKSLTHKGDCRDLRKVREWKLRMKL